MKKLAWLIVAFTIILNLFLYYPETKILADPNDNAFQYSLVYRTNWVWENYGCPISLSCLPNLLDHNVPAWVEGYPLPFYYSHVPQIAIVATYNVIVEPIVSIFNLQFSIYNYYNWTKYLLLCFFPLPIFLALRIVGFSSVLAALGALFSAHFSTDGLYGIDPPSFLWRGYGLTSQLYAMMFLPLGIAYMYRSLSVISFPLSVFRLKFTSFQVASLINRKQTNHNPITENRKPITNVYLAIFFLTLTTAGHLGLGIIGLLSAVPFLFIHAKPKLIMHRIKFLAVIACGVVFLLSYWIIPILLENNYHIISFWDPIWKFNSYGWYEVIRQTFQGELFDWGRPPVITFLVFTGFFAALLSRRFPFALLFTFWFLLYFGRTTWGGIIDLIPGMKDFHQHRFIVGIHMAGIFLIPVGINQILQFIQTLINLTTKKSAFADFCGLARFSKEADLRTNRSIANNYSHVKNYNGVDLEGVEPSRPEFLGPAPEPSRPTQQLSYVLFRTIASICISIFIYVTIHQTIEYNSLNTKWIYEANDAYRHDENHFSDLITRLRELPNGRIYAGRPGNWGKQLRLGSSELYMLLGTYGFDMSQFLPETWSPMSENEQDFDERIPEDYDLLNIRYIVATKNQGFPENVKQTEYYGPFQLYETETTGWFDVVSSPMLVHSDKTNFINVVHLWHRSFPRTWNMHPIITVKSPNSPFPLQRTISMVDEVTYRENGQNKNIFAEFPFVFPEATISGIIRGESVQKQTYQATIDVPNPCPSCMIMFKMSYHPDWQVMLDGKPAQTYAVFPFYLATPAMPGTHTISFMYKPNTLKTLLVVVELLAGIGFIVWFFIMKRKKFFSST